LEKSAGGQMAKKKEIFEVPLGETKVLLHTCCAPCSSAIIEHLIKHGVTPIIYYCNPNIYPREEYEIRKDECTRYAQALGLEIIDADYDHENWLEAVKGLETEPERGGRCLKCFKLRLLRTAEYAAEHGIRVITSTLASSRWKSLDQINDAGTWACQQIADRLGVDDFPIVGPIYWTYNWKKGGLQERRLQIIKEYDFYNQRYCGCEFSMPDFTTRTALSLTSSGMPSETRE
jgi:predicted adenine nucleotide alpha hydrolase (AANH) superfamily ATPase